MEKAASIITKTILFFYKKQLPFRLILAVLIGLAFEQRRLL